MTTTAPEPIHLDLATESENPCVTETDSLCMQCMKQGTTRLLLTQIPHFKEVMISSFLCPHCHHSDNSLLNIGNVQNKGVKITLKVSNSTDIKRTVVKSDVASVKIPEIELEIPATTGKGEITNVEGIINKVCQGLQMNQEQRREMTPEVAEQIEEFIKKLEHLIEGQTPFTLELNDPSGNSYIESLDPIGNKDFSLKKEFYERTEELDEMLAISKDLEKTKLEDLKEEEEEEVEGINEGINDKRQEVMRFPPHECEKCHQITAITNMKLTDIPHFKEVIVMGTTCDECGHKTNQIMPGGETGEKGRKICLKLTDSEFDLARDVLKSHTCDISIPELELEVGAGILGGKFTTIEGLFSDIRDDMKSNPFFTGDSATEETKNRINTIFSKIEQVLAGELMVTIILDDPAGNSYLQNIYAPDDDPNMTISDYERSHDQNEDLGLNQLKTEGYEQD